MSTDDALMSIKTEDPSVTSAPSELDVVGVVKMEDGVKAETTTDTTSTPGQNEEEEDIEAIEVEEEAELAPKRRRGRPEAPKLSANEVLERLDDLLGRLTAATTGSNSTAVSPSSSKKAGAAAGSKRGDHRHDKRMKTEQEEDTALLEDELNEAPPEVAITQQPSIITANMRKYQIEALSWMVRLHDSNINGILADEMGLGKTLETISLLAYLRESRGINGPHLILVPKSTLTNWVREIKKWCPDFSLLAFHGTKEEREELRPKVGTTDILVTTYEICIIERAIIRSLQFEYIIIDEAHRIKNENSKLSLVVRTFPTRHRLLITGTPLQNNLHELWALLNFLKPEIFSAHDDFEVLFDLSNSEENDTIVKRLHRVLRPFLLRRLKTDVEALLPPKVETKLFVGLTEMQRHWYKRLLERDYDALQGNANDNKTRLLNMVIQLRKVCNHPYLFEGAEPGPPYEEGPHIVDNCGKMVLLDKLLARLKEQGSRVLIFSQMTRLLDILEDYCLFRDYQYCRIDGSTKQDERDEAMDVFNRPNSEKFIFLLSTRAGGLGINLQTADTVILYDSDWNPQMDLQAQDRAHRIGQKKQVNVYRFVTEGTIEEKIIERATRKLALDAMVIQKGRLLEQEKNVSARELQSMIRFGASYIYQGSGTTISDEDIDAILARGQERTREESSRLQASENSLLNFSLFDDKEPGSLHEFEGKDYRGGREADPFLLFAPPPRERKPTASADSSKDEEKVRAPKEFKPNIRPDHQFFNNKRLEELERKQFEGEIKFRENCVATKQRLREERKLKAQREREERRLQLQLAREKRRQERAAMGETDDNDEEDEAAERALKEEEEAEARAEAEAARRDARELAGLGGDDDDVEEEDADEEEAEEEDEEEDGEEEVDETEEKKGSESDMTISRSASPTPAESTSSSTSTSSKSQAASSTAASSDDAMDAAAPAVKKRVKSKRSRLDVALGIIRKTFKPGKKNAPGVKRVRTDPFAQELDYEALRREAGCLTPEEEAEYQALLAEGFGDWRKLDLQRYIAACASYGRTDIASISKNVESKSPTDVERYHAVFWKRYHEIKDHDKLIKQIERGEAQLKRRKEIEKLLDAKVHKYADPVLDMNLDYPAKQHIYNSFEDRFLILSMRHHGFGNWEAVRRDILQAPQFRFDWFIRSRTAAELGRRGDYLLKLLEKDAEKEKKPPAKPTKGSTSTAGSKSDKGDKSEKAEAAGASSPASKKGDSKKSSPPTKKGDTKKGSDKESAKESSKDTKDKDADSTKDTKKGGSAKSSSSPASKKGGSRK